MVKKKFVIKRDGKRKKFDQHSIEKAVKKAFEFVNELAEKNEFKTEHIKGYDKPDFDFFESKLWKSIDESIDNYPYRMIPVEAIQDIVENALMDNKFHKVAKAYILYRDQHLNARFVRSRIDFMDNYSANNENAATSSETDANANVTIKNVNTLEPEVFKTMNRLIQRCRMSDQLNIDFPDTDLDDMYEKDIDGHEDYVHDEASTPTLKYYCQADSIYPLMLNGIGNLDGGKTESAPNNISSFSGQLVNFIHAASGACKGAVAIGGYFPALNYYIVQEFGDKWYDHLDEVYTTPLIKKSRTVWDKIRGAFKQFVYGVNQPAGNRGGQSPFTNISYFDETYFNAMFGDFYYPDGTKPEWKAIDKLQRLFMNWFNERRLKTILTFPVETLAMVYDPDTHQIIDKSYRDLCADMYAKGHSFFTYISDSADSLASCCFEGSEIIKVKKNEKEFNISIEDFVNNLDNTINKLGNTDINEKYTIVSFDEKENKKEDVEITGTLKRKYTGKMYKIYYTETKYINVTADHIVKVKNIKTNKIENIEAEKLMNNFEDYLLVADN